ncbi:cytochrome c [Pseudodesulfovibrio sp. JC047]|uniref:c-type cytochrome n=1 Tax=Pseudodesulfovibrio sp. JC047 TaxID=2683199 RepID=UPI0013D260C3|nr:cytochrome c [Pseudodesulfovibrio sp. JC047]NDV20475.1 cytochrome c [Pseudodesulfovibrio sp. JC047]
MHRTFTVTVASVLMTVFVVSMAFAMGDGNARKGKFLYRKNCRTCHNGTQAPDLSPADRTQAEWTDTFKNETSIPCAGEWGVSDKDVNDIFTYLHDYAKDSPSPAKCS